MSITKINKFSEVVTRLSFSVGNNTDGDSALSCHFTLFGDGCKHLIHWKSGTLTLPLFREVSSFTLVYVILKRVFSSAGSTKST
ncbi:Uncharacterised protein [Vibrio mimicus]|nr:Uncharacterised protein [Vibrio mimicus]